MKILISGCSFTQWPEYPGGPNICWPKHFAEINPEHEIRCVAEPAAGNQYIADSVVRSVITERPNHVLVMWSGVSRLDFLTSLEDPNWESMYDSYGFYRRVDQCPSELGYIFSGGRVGTWFDNSVAKQMFTQMYKVSSPLSLASINIMEMIKTQHFLKSKGIPYHFMSYVNYWTSEEHVSRNGDFGVMAFPQLKSMINELDFSQWIFTNDRRDGIFEIAKETNNFQPDGFHPGDTVSKSWANIVNQRVKDFYQ
jgi:hypothetical protein